MGIGVILPFLASLLGGMFGGGGSSGTGSANDPELQALMRRLLSLQTKQTTENEPLRQAVTSLAFRRLPIHARAGFTLKQTPEGLGYPFTQDTTGRTTTDRGV